MNATYAVSAASEGARRSLDQVEDGFRVFSLKQEDTFASRTLPVLH